MNNLWILAEVGGNEGEIIEMESDSAAVEQTAATIQDGSDNAGTEGTQTNPQAPNMMLWFMLPVLLVYMFFMFRGPKKKQQEHNKMVSSLEKNDHWRCFRDRAGCSG